MKPENNEPNQSVAIRSLALTGRWRGTTTFAFLEFGEDEHSGQQPDSVISGPSVDNKLPEAIAKLALKTQAPDG
jgi:hypothetical protein